jgi:hypothetical protein
MVGSCCSFPYLAMAHDVLAPPTGNFELGPYSLVVFVSTISHCPGQQTLCPITASQTESLYTIILFMSSPPLGRTNAHGHTLLQFPLPP